MGNVFGKSDMGLVTEVCQKILTTQKLTDNPIKGGSRICINISPKKMPTAVST